jgi:hypothetical protein
MHWELEEEMMMVRNWGRSGMRKLLLSYQHDDGSRVGGSSDGGWW